MERTRILLSDEKLRSESLFKKIDRRYFSVEVCNFLQLSSLEKCDLAIPITLPEILLLNRDFPELRGIKYFAPTNEVMYRAHDKIVFNQFLRDRGFEEFVPRMDTRKYPFVIKNHKDAGGANSFLIESDSDWDQHHDLLNTKGYFSQVYVSGETEYTTHVFLNDNVFRATTVRFRMNQSRYIRGIRTQRMGGIDVGLVEGRFDDVFLEILRELDFQGFGCFNFKITEGRLQIFELNPRIGGSAHWGINEILQEFRRPLSALPTTACD